MKQSHVRDHVASEKHRRHIQHQPHIQNVPLTPASIIPQATNSTIKVLPQLHAQYRTTIEDVPDEESPQYYGASLCDEGDSRSHTLPPEHLFDPPNVNASRVSPSPHNEPPTPVDEPQERLGDLYSQYFTNRTFTLDDAGEDLFQKIQEQDGAVGVLPFNISTSHELGIDGDTHQDGVADEMDEEFELGIDGDIHQDSADGGVGREPLASLGSLEGKPTYPWPSMEKKAVLKWAKAMGAPTVPSLGSLKKCQENIKNIVGDSTEKITSPAGNVFYLNKISQAIAMDYANPITRLAMSDYPRDDGVKMSDHFSGEKMLFDIPEDVATPSVSVGGECSNGRYFIPQRFFYTKSESVYGTAHNPDVDPEWLLSATGFNVEWCEAGFIVDEDLVVTPVDDFWHSFKEISTSAEFACRFTASSEKWATKMPHPMRQKAQGRRVISVPLIVFMDDVSGNISKQWNKHHAIYMSNGNLPREMIEKEFCVRFVTSSPHASPMELMTAMKDSIAKAYESGVVAYDAKYDEESAEMRKPEETAEEACRQVRLSMMPNGSEKMKTAMSTNGVHDSTTDAIVASLIEMGKRLRTKPAPGTPRLPESEVQRQLEQQLETLLGNRSLNEAINPLLGMPGVNIHMDTPTEILHTVLLGVVKYFWAQTVFILEKSKSFEIFHTRLSSFNMQGLSATNLNADYVCRYKGGLIGKHFKSLAQVMPFLIYDLVPQSVLNGWTVIGRLVVLLWHTTIEDREVYLAELSRVIEDFLTITAQCAPSILLSKPKFHFLIHIPAYIRRFGPAILFSTERYESFNHVFRLTCIFSNRQAPSRDTCRTFSNQDRIKHIVFGGYWFNSSLRRWVRAGGDVLDYMKADPTRAQYLGFTAGSKTKPGTVRLSHERSKPPEPYPWYKTQCASVLGSTDPTTSTNPAVYRADSFVALHGDTVQKNASVIVTNASGASFIAKVLEILMPNDGTDLATNICVQQFDFLPLPHPTLHLPRVQLSPSKVVVSPMDILCAVNVQHECSVECNSTRSETMRQERLETERTRNVIIHTNSNIFLLNTHSLHNYRHILSSLPPSLVPRPLLANGDEIRRNAATQMRSSKNIPNHPPTNEPLPNENDSADTLLEPPAFETNQHTSKKGKAKATQRKRAREDDTTAEQVPKRRRTVVQPVESSLQPIQGSSQPIRDSVQPTPMFNIARPLLPATNRSPAPRH
ncbi:hypothetical protein BD779DRAFT_1478341 [Infundibulicybe gibba]|nr:hypothetical protein BD779DRAFT_1478341 [Infundibulicybe gibba]